MPTQILFSKELRFKMGKTRKGSKSNEASNQTREDAVVKKGNMAKLLNEKLTKIDDDIARDGTMNSDEALLAMYLAFFGPDSMYNIKDMYKKVNTIEDSLSKHNDYIHSLEEKVRTLEFESHKTKILLRNIPLVDEKENRENFKQTRSTVEELLSFSDLKMDSISDFYRLYPRKDSTNNPSKKQKVEGKSPVLFISFTNIHGLRSFTKKLSELKKEKKYEKTIMEFSCPPSLMSEYLSAQKESFRLRTERNMITNCKITKNSIKLFVRSRKETKFTEVSFPKNQ